MFFLPWILFFIIVILINGSTIDIESTTQSLAYRNAVEIQKLRDEVTREEKQFRINRQKFEKEKQIRKSLDHTDVLQLNVGGEIIITTRHTLTKISKSTLYFLFNGQWEDRLQRDSEGNIFFDFNPILFRHLLDQLQIIEIDDAIQLYPPLQPSLVEPFKRLLRKLGFQQSLSSEKHNVITFNVGGQKITNRRTTFTQASKSTFDTIAAPTKMMKLNNESDVFVDYDPKLFQHLISQLRKGSFQNISDVKLPLHEEKVSFQNLLDDLSIYRNCSNFIKKENWDYPGNDLGPVIHQNTYEDCCAQCSTNDKCNAFTWKRAEQICYLKSSIGVGGNSHLEGDAAARKIQVVMIALKSTVNDKFVSVQHAGNRTLIANADAVQSGEKFKLVHLGGSKIALKALVNNMYVTVENAEDNLLTANRSSIGLSETFEMSSSNNGKMRFKSMANNLFVCAENGGEDSLTASREWAYQWEEFEIHEL